MRAKLVGTVAVHPVMGIGVQRPDGTWITAERTTDGKRPSLTYLLDFSPAFGGLFSWDVGKRVYRSGSYYSMENDRQRDERLAR